MVPNQYGVRAATEIQRNAEPFGEIFHISRLLREDYDFVLNVPKTFGADVLQANDKPSTLTERGHQYPAAFLNLGSLSCVCYCFPLFHFFWQ
jgi:leucyl aminopeptidase